MVRVLEQRYLVRSCFLRITTRSCCLLHLYSPGVPWIHARESFTSGTRIIKMGDDGDYMFVIQSGKLDCIKPIDGEDKVVKTCETGDVFGELALLCGPVDILISNQ